MADVHIGRINKTEEGKGRVQLIYHIPLDVPVSGVVPTPGSRLAGLEQAEIDALAAGTLVEITRDMVVESGQNKLDIVAAIKKDWQNIKVDYNKKFNFEYKFFGETIADANT